MLNRDVVEDSVCHGAGLVMPEVVRSCNRVTCPSARYWWRVGTWSECESVTGCGMGVSTRAVECVSGQGTTADDTFCTSIGLAKPVVNASQPCDTNVACGCSSTKLCLGSNQHCTIPSTSQSSSGVCVCDDGWAGINCSVADITTFSNPGALAGGCPNGIIDTNGTCCDREIDVVSGVCCGDGEVADMHGRCCGSQLDGCGVCNGSGVALTATGACCATPLTASGECCDADEPVDSCGVCGGLNACSAVVKLSLDIQVTVNADMQNSTAPPASSFVGT